MSIFFNKTERVNPLNPSVSKRWYLVLKSAGLHIGYADTQDRQPCLNKLSEPLCQYGHVNISTWAC